jgi:methylmalonyl-CoA mutase cobalamin-binding subunit
MGDDASQDRSGSGGPQRSAIKFLVESALRKVASNYTDNRPRNRDEWIERLCEALMSESETSHHGVISAIMANGVSGERFFQEYVPAAAQRLGEMWIADRASFVDVTLGASRLQALFRAAPEAQGSTWVDRSIPLGQSVLLIIPPYEQHSLGAFVAADHFRRHGVWVRMSIGLEERELAEVIAANRFSMLAFSLATWKSVEKTGELVKFLRSHVDRVPPVVVGGRIVSERACVEKASGADFAVKSVREAIERGGLATVSEPLTASNVN